jgi:hypothetical protein
LEDLRENLQNSLDQTTEAAYIASELSNEWWMETATELDDYSIRIRNIIEDLDATLLRKVKRCSRTLRRT